MRRYKARHLGKAVADVHLDAWDRLYYISMAKARSLRCMHQGCKHRAADCKLNMPQQPHRKCS